MKTKQKQKTSSFSFLKAVLDAWGEALVKYGILQNTEHILYA